MNLTFRPIGDDWPGAITPESDRKSSPFSATWEATKELLDREVDMVANRGKFHAPAVIQLAVPEGAIRQDGQLAAGRAAPEHPGVILTFDGPDGPLRFSCDKFGPAYWKPTLNGWQTNARAIALGLEALRKVDRYGLGTGSEQYRGFQALGSGVAMGAVAEAMTIETAINLLREGSNWQGDFDPLADRIHIDIAYREAAKSHHPDRGGSPATFRRLTEARDLLAGGS